MLKIVKLGHPVLRAKAEPIAGIDDSLRKLADDMLDTMYAHDGCGLAANQVGVARRVVVIDVREARKRPSVLRIGGKARPVHKHMPMVLINPEVEPVTKEQIRSTSTATWWTSKPRACWPAPCSTNSTISTAFSSSTASAQRTGVAWPTNCTRWPAGW